jgi:hypothetical protein
MQPISRNSVAPNPRVVPAAAPRRTPDVTVGVRGSKGTPFLLQVMFARPRAFSAMSPVSRFGRWSSRIKVRVGSAGDEIVAGGAQHLAHRLAVLHDRTRVYLEFRPQGLAERDRFGGDDVHQRPALQTGKDRRIDLLCDLGVVCQHHAAARPAQCLVRRHRYDMRVSKRIGMCAAGNETGEMCHVHHQDCADFVRNSAKVRKVDHPRIGGPACDDDARTMHARQPRDFVHVDAVIGGPDTVVHRLEPLARKVGRRAVCKVSAGRERQPEDGVPRPGEGEQHRLVGLAARARLHIGEITPE